MFDYLTTMSWATQYRPACCTSWMLQNASTIQAHFMKNCSFVRSVRGPSGMDP